MYYIFEDNESSEISKLFVSAYPADVADKFRFAGGGGGIVGVIDNLVEQFGAVDIIIFMDFVPGNLSIVRVRDSILEKMGELKALGGSSILVPLVCAEYYVIKAMVRQGVLDMADEDIKICVEKGLFEKSSLLSRNNRASVNCNSFEKYCKLILETKGLKKCSNNVGNNNYKAYYRHGCNNNCSLHSQRNTGYYNKEREKLNVKCPDIEMSIHDKALELLLEYPIVPKGSLWKKREALSEEGEFRSIAGSVNGYGYTVIKNESIDDKLKILERAIQLMEEFNNWDTFYANNVDCGVRGGFSKFNTDINFWIGYI